MIQSLIGNLGQTQSNGQTGTGTGGIITSIIGSIFGGAAGGNGAGAAAAADGAIFPGGFTPVGMYATGGVVKGGRGMLGIIGEGGPGRDEAIVPMVGGQVPLRFQGGGLVAALPGGRSIPAGVMAFADGGIAAGGYSPISQYADMGNVPVMQGGGGGRGGNVYIVSSKEEAQRKGYDQKRDTMITNARIENVVAASVKSGVVGKTIRRRTGS